MALITWEQMKKKCLKYLEVSELSSYRQNTKWCTYFSTQFCCWSWGRCSWLNFSLQQNVGWNVFCLQPECKKLKSRGKKRNVFYLLFKLVIEIEIGSRKLLKENEISITIMVKVLGIQLTPQSNNIYLTVIASQLW